MNIKHVHREMIRCQAETGEHVAKRHGLAVRAETDKCVLLCPSLLLHEPQQVLVVHARGCMNVSIHL